MKSIENLLFKQKHLLHQNGSKRELTTEIFTRKKGHGQNTFERNYSLKSSKITGHEKIAVLDTASTLEETIDSRFCLHVAVSVTQL